MHMPWNTSYRELIIVFSSLLLQVPLAYFLGHYYDQRVFMATGYLVGSGLNPYTPHQLVNVFPNPLLGGTIPAIGYPPPWSFVLGLVYRLSFKIVPDLFLYNFATKIPVIIGNIGLAYLVRSILTNLQVARKKAQTAWLFLLFNPFVLLTTSAWGQFDTVVALFCLASLYFLSKNRISECALSLAVSVALKPLAFPLVPLPFLSSVDRPLRKNLLYLLVFAVALLACWIGPFYAFGWNIPILSDWNPYFKMAGGMSPFNLVEIIQDSLSIPSAYQFLGYLWLPSLFVGYYAVYRSRPNSMEGLIQKAIGLTLIFFLTRTWLSEPNIDLVLPLMVMVVALNRISSRSLHLAWIIPTAFMFLNTSFNQLFFLVNPSVLTSLAGFDQQFRSIRLIARFAVVVLWQILAWSVVAKMLRREKDEAPVAL
jgi:hypothetical protein